MATIQEQLSGKVDEIKQALSGVSEEQATKRSADGEWCIKEVLAHLSGAEDALTMYQLKRFVNEDNPDLSLTPGEISYTKERESAPVSKLVSDLENQYTQIGTFFAGLSEEQLGRKGRVAFLKETPIGEYPTLGQWAGAIINFHLPDHIQQIRTLAHQ
jgi:hypothetical protein